jgi:hypothetical protein
MKHQEFIAWEPLSDIERVLYVEAIHDDTEGFRILLRGTQPTSPVLRIHFESYVAYRNVNESYRNRTWQDESLTRDLPSLLKVCHSKWARWASQEASGAVGPEEMIHYAIYTPEDCVDVLALSEPVVDWPSGLI